MRHKLRANALFLLRVPALFYLVVITVRNLVYDLLPGLSKAIAIPIICVGNITVGGTGKTPMTAFLAEYFQSLGLRVAILSRGYGRRDKKKQKIITSPAKPKDLHPDEIGDEALMLLQQLKDITLVLDADRVRGAETVYRENRADIIILDDGFQHRRLRRDFNLVMIDSHKLFGNRQLLPAGSLREPLSALKRADAVIFNKFDQHHPEFYRRISELLDYVAPGKLFCARYKYKEFTSLNGKRTRTLAEMRKYSPVHAVSGLANNGYFFTQLKASGLKLAESFAFADHHVYSRKEFNELKKFCGQQPLITTEKDADKLRLLAAADETGFLQNIWAVRIELELQDEARFYQLLTKFLP
jgi:tetraacyldisaccharide 4'-kinase